MSSLTIATICLASSFLLTRYYLLTSSFLTTFLVLYGVVFFSKVTYAVVLYPHFFSPIRHLPSPPGGNFLLGHSLDLLRKPAGEPQIAFMRSVPNRGLIRYRAFLNKEYIMMTSPETIKEILRTQAYTLVKPAYFRTGLGRVFGPTALAFAEGEEHRHQRKLLTPAFSHGHIKTLVPTFWDRSVQLRDKIEQVISATGKAGGKEAVVDMAAWLPLATLDIIGAAGLGYECNALASAPVAGGRAEGGSELAEAYDAVFTQGSDAAKVISLLVGTLPLVAKLPIQRNRQVQKAVATINRITARMVQEKKAQVAKTSEPGPGDGKNILTIMLRSGHYSAEADSSIRDQLLTFLAAGHETTATALTWAVYYLSLPEYRHAQERLRAEIYSRFPGGLPETVTYDAIESLKYMRNFMMEVLRLRTPVAILLRRIGRDTTLGGEFVPKGTDVIIPLLAINRSIELWGEDADEFNPDRWEGPEGTNNFFMTFSTGPRGCIGASFAKAEFKCLLMALVGSFEFEEAEELKGKKLVVGGIITQKPADGVPVCVRKVRWGGE